MKKKEQLALIEALLTYLDFLGYEIPEHKLSKEGDFDDLFTEFKENMEKHVDSYQHV